MCDEVAVTRSHEGWVARIDALLPQTQCRQCGYAGCGPYAAAVAAGRAGTNQCPPGGEETARALAALMETAYAPPDPRYGATKPPLRAVIDETLCIGCTLCIQACPVDAIVGAAKLMHTVIAADCTGCELCVPPCPVDCIALEPVRVNADPAARRLAAARARSRYERREARLGRARPAGPTAAADAGSARRRTVQRALERARERLDRRK